MKSRQIFCNFREVGLVEATNDRVEEALATYLDYLEMGGNKPDASHLTAIEQGQLQDLINALELTDGVAFGLGRREENPDIAPGATPKRIPTPGASEDGRRLASQLRNALPFDVRIDSDPVDLFSQVGGFDILERWIVGTFGGRIRVWLLSVDVATDLETDNVALLDLTRVFQSLPDTTAIALVAKDLSCLLIEPEDCGPQIQVPGGSLVSPRYRRPIQAISEALRGFLNELVPNWDPVPEFTRDRVLSIDVTALSDEYFTKAIDKQKAIGNRAHKGNPKKDALLALGEREIKGLSKLAAGLFEGSLKPEEVGIQLERLAKRR
jgi:hypothetical protein